MFKISESMKVASIWVVWAFLSIGVLGWALFHVLNHFGVNDQAAWVQAIGSIGAIFAAVEIFKRQGMEAALLRKQDAQAMQAGRTQRLYGLLYETCQILAQLVDQLEKDKSTAPDAAAIELFNRIHRRAVMNFDDDLDSGRQLTVSEYRHAFGVFIHQCQQRMSQGDPGKFPAQADTCFQAIKELLEHVQKDLEFLTVDLGL